MKTLLRPHILTALLGGVLLSACLFGTSPAKLNEQIEKGEAARALTAIEEKLTDDGENPTLNLLAVKARLALCHQRSCATEVSGTLPALLTGLPKLAAHVTGPVTLDKKTPPLTLSGVFASAMAQYQTAPQQPAPVLALYNSAPAALQPQLAAGLFQPALTLVRNGNPSAAAQVLATLADADNLPPTYTYAAHMLSGMLGNDSANKDANLIALRSVTAPQLPASAAGLLPWAILQEATPAAPSAVLATLPQRLAALKLPNLLGPTAMDAIAQELVTTSQTPAAAARWQTDTSSANASLALQRMALVLDPNQPNLWATYLPALVSATITAQSTTSLDGLTSLQSDTEGTASLPPVTLTSATAPRVATEVIRAAGQLVNFPGVATPLVTFASRLPLSKQQEIDLEKLSQTLLIKAAEQGDVTSTLVLAQTLPGVAQNNRQSVVPLLVKFIRGNLHAGNFTAATNTANFLTNTLKMDIEFAPLVLEEFADDLKARGVPAQLNASTTEILLQPAETSVVDLGPLFTFMQDYFQDQPKVISAQLTTLIAGATGTYGQPTAMYRLGSYFPESVLPAAKQQEWLAASLEQSLLADTTLTATTLADTAAKLAVVHPGMNLAPIMETAVKRAGSLEDQRTLWQGSTPSVREVFRAIRPEFTMLMQGIDALAAGQLNSSAQALSGITDPTWRTEAQPFIEQFNTRLLTLSGIYVPVSAVPTFKTAAIVLSPQGLQGGKLNTVSVTFISRVGTLNEAEPTSLRTNAAATHRFTLPVTYNFDTRSLGIQPNAVAQTAQGGTFGPTYGNVRTLKLQANGNDDTSAPLLNVTLADGSTTTFIRTLLDPSQSLKPDGTYLLQARMGTTPSATLGILPPGSMLTIASSDNPITPPAEADTDTALVYPVTGTVRHPAAANPIPFTGYYDADLLTTTFIFNYPLPTSAQPARAAVRCQALAGPITCGAHNLNSARQAYAAMVTGLQTRESLATAVAQRNTLNSAGASRILAGAIPTITMPSPTLSVSSTGGLLAAPTFLASPSGTMVTSSTTVSVTIAAPSPTSLVSNLLPAAVSKTATEEEDTEEEAPAPRHNRFADEPETGAFVNHSGGNTSPTTPAIVTPSNAKPASAPAAAPSPAPVAAPAP